ncbi:MAG: D-alanyl-D-alanine dipeptidase, partial [Myxococcaceae bacterium]|nr:D-alanyl-D-alanine dipeptidase [Myxococcaceae bacterium]
ALVEVRQLIPDVVLDLRYATKANFLGEQVYPDGSRCLLRRDAAERLVRAADALRKRGFRLRVYDCYRPLEVQWKMWRLMPKPGYVADPRKGGNHNRGAAVDLTLATPDGAEVEMPTPFDTFSPAAHHGYQGASEVARRHRELLRDAMEGAGFERNRMEWWHYDLPGARGLPVRDEPLTRRTPAPPRRTSGARA